MLITCQTMLIICNYLSNYAEYLPNYADYNEIIGIYHYSSASSSSNVNWFNCSLIMKFRARDKKIMSPSDLLCCSSQKFLSSENTRSDAAEDGWSKTSFEHTFHQQLSLGSTVLYLTVGRLRLTVGRLRLTVGRLRLQTNDMRTLRGVRAEHTSIPPLNRYA